MDRRGFLAHLGASATGCLAAAASVPEAPAQQNCLGGSTPDFHFLLARAYHADDYLHCMIEQMDLAGPMGPRYQVYSQEIRQKLATAAVPMDQIAFCTF